jgi:hypothetical protein
MRKILSLLIVSVLVISGFSFSFAQTINLRNTQKTTFMQDLPKMSTGFFTENKGQWDPEILFIGDTSFGKVAFTKEAIYYQMIKVTVKETENDSALSMQHMPNRLDQKEREYESQVVKLSFVDSLTPTIQGAEVLSHYNNYFIGNDPSKWASYCRNFAKVTYEDVWSGIDLAYFFTPEGMKYEYYVDPEADIQDLQIEVDGAELSNQGTSLQIATSLGSIQDANLIVFDQGTDKELQSKFVVKDDIFSFQGIPENRENTIVIDPLVWSTFLGGSGKDIPAAITIDNYDHVYVTGFTDSINFPISSGSFQQEYKGKSWNAFVAKINTIGTNLIFSTYLGGSDWDVATGIKVDQDGNLYISGYSHSKDFPTTPGVLQSKNNGNHNATVTKLNSTGTKLIFSTYFGGSSSDNYYGSGGIDIDIKGNVYIAGTTVSFDFPTTSGAFQKEKKGWQVAFISKLNPTGTTLLYSTLLGGSDSDSATAMAIDDSGNVYITGLTSSSDFPLSLNAFQHAFKGGDYDVFVSKLDLGSPDTTHPEITIDYPKNLTTTEQSSIDIRGKVVDEESGIKDLTINGISQSFASDGSFEKKNNPLVEGLNQFEIKATNGVDLSTIKILKIFKEKKDTTPPTITVLHPKNNAVVNVSKILVSCKIEDDTGISGVYVNNQEVELSMEGYIETFVGLVEGPNTIVITATDQAGNEARETIHVTYQKDSILVIVLTIGDALAYINGQRHQLDSPPMIKNGRTFVPLRFIGEAFGAEVKWIPHPTNEAQVRLKGKLIHLWIGKIDAIIEYPNESRREPDKVKLDSAPFIHNGRTLVPLRFIAEIFDAQVEWESRTQKITITLGR